jgi:UDP-glucose 4-epimerase
VYNVCAARTYSVRELIDILRLQTTVPFITECDPVLVRRCDEPVIVGDSSRFQRATKWKQTYELTNTIENMLAWWRRSLRSELDSQPAAAYRQEATVASLLPRA